MRNITIEANAKQLTILANCVHAMLLLYLGQWPQAFEVIYPNETNLSVLPQDLQAILTIVNWKKYQVGKPTISVNSSDLTDDVRTLFDLFQVLKIEAHNANSNKKPLKEKATRIGKYPLAKVTIIKEEQ